MHLLPPAPPVPVPTISIVPAVPFVTVITTGRLNFDIDGTKVFYKEPPAVDGHFLATAASIQCTRSATICERLKSEFVPTSMEDKIQLLSFFSPLIQ